LRGVMSLSGLTAASATTAPPGASVTNPSPGASGLTAFIGGMIARKLRIPQDGLRYPRARSRVAK
jgi:hypothetical protein